MILVRPRAFVALLPLSMNAAGVTVGNGQMGLHVLPLVAALETVAEGLVPVIRFGVVRVQRRDPGGRPAPGISRRTPHRPPGLNPRMTTWPCGVSTRSTSRRMACERSSE